MKPIKYLMSLVQKKKLNRAEKRSLLSSIQSCDNFGTNAHEFIISCDIYDSIIFSYCRALRYFDVPFISFRETERYKFMLELSIQQTWSKGLGDILSRTKFFNVQSVSTYEGLIPFEGLHFAMQSFFANHSYEEVVSIVVKSYPETRFVSIYHHDSRLIICAFSKKTNKFNISRVLQSLNGAVTVTTESEVKERERMVAKMKKLNQDSSDDATTHKETSAPEESPKLDDAFLYTDYLPDSFPSYSLQDVFEEF